MVPELVVKLCQLAAEIRHSIVEVGRLLLSIRRGVASQPGLGAGASSTRLGLGAKLFEQPDPFDQSLVF
ncbi:MAG TPA: hypothetical protein VHJ37_01035 [Thermoleophilaceae bacterium]|nr:hypothetical protein [Thermoleophilaceae bacterium]